MAVHALITWPNPFQDVWDGRKSFEIRWNDRPFHVGDLLVLREYTPRDLSPSGEASFSGREIVAEVRHVEVGTWGLPPTLAVLGIETIACLDDEGKK